MDHKTRKLCLQITKSHFDLLKITRLTKSLHPKHHYKHEGSPNSQRFLCEQEQLPMSHFIPIQVTNRLIIVISLATSDFGLNYTCPPPLRRRRHAPLPPLLHSAPLPPATSASTSSSSSVMPADPSSPPLHSSSTHYVRIYKFPLERDAGRSL